MAFSPIVVATLQATILAAISNILAQALTSFKKEIPLIIDWVPVVQFAFFTILNTPPNFMWQDFLERTWPATTKATPTDEAIASAAANDEKALDDEQRKGRIITEPKLDVANTAIKTLLDQTVGMAVNTAAFLVVMGGLQAAMRPRPDEAVAHHPHRSVEFLLSGRAVDYGRVDWNDVTTRARADFWPVLSAGWRLWPFVSIVNFAFVKKVETRNLVGALAGVGWGVYMSLVAAQ